MSAFTARDLGITGPHLVYQTIDGDYWIVDEVLGYQVEWCSVQRGTKHWTATFTCRLPGAADFSTWGATLDRLVVMTP